MIYCSLYFYLFISYLSPDLQACFRVSKVSTFYLNGVVLPAINLLLVTIRQAELSIVRYLLLKHNSVIDLKAWLFNNCCYKMFFIHAVDTINLGQGFSTGYSSLWDTNYDFKEYEVKLFCISFH